MRASWIRWLYLAIVEGGFVGEFPARWREVWWNTLTSRHLHQLSPSTKHRPPDHDHRPRQDRPRDSRGAAKRRPHVECEARRTRRAERDALRAAAQAPGKRRLYWPLSRRAR